MDPARIPVVVGVGNITQKEHDMHKLLSPIDLAAKTIRKCVKDCQIKDIDSFLKDTVCIGTVQMFYEQRYKKHFKHKPFTNFTLSLAKSLNINLPSDFVWESFSGGNGPQFMINKVSQLITKQTIPQGPIFIGGVETCSSFDKLIKSKDKQTVLQPNTTSFDEHKNRVSSSWSDREADENHKTLVNDHIGKLDNMTSKDVQDIAHIIGNGLTNVISSYALLENRYIADCEVDFKTAMINRAKLFSEMSEIAGQNHQNSWYPIKRSPEEILLLDETVLKPDSKFFLKTSSQTLHEKTDNRMISFPYTKYMVARDEVNMSAFVCLMSLAEARRRGVPEKNIIYLHATSDAIDTPIIAQRDKISATRAMDQAYSDCISSLSSTARSNLKHFDIYSCFPIAVFQGIRNLTKLGVMKTSESLPEASVITQAGGLPYHGGPGSNYPCHALCALITKLRLPECSEDFGMICANGGFLTEHSCGVYSREPLENPLSVQPVKYFSFEKEIELRPSGECKIVTWTVEYKRKYKQAIIIGETNEGKRFGARTRPKDFETIDWLLTQDRTNEYISVETSLTDNFTLAKLVSVPLVFFEKRDMRANI